MKTSTKRTFLSIFYRSFLLLMATIDTQHVYAQHLEWANIVSVGGSIDIYDIATDNQSNVFAVGQTTYLPGKASIYIQKRDKNGSFLWEKTLGFFGSRAKRVTVDSLGNAYVMGTFNEGIDFDTEGGVAYAVPIEPALTTSDVFIVKYDPNGHFEWLRTIGSLTADYGYGIAYDPAGFIYATGSFKGTMYLGAERGIQPDTAVSVLISQNQYDGYILKLSLEGTFVWAKSDDLSTLDANYSVDYDQGSVLIAGLQKDEPGNDWLYVIKKNATSKNLWQRLFFTNADISSFSTVTNKKGIISIGGSFKGSMDFSLGTEQISVSSTPDFYSAFVLQLDSLGNFSQIKTFNSGASCFLNSLSIDPNGDLYATGSFSDTADFSIEAISGGYLLKLDSLANFKWAKKVGDEGLSIFVDNSSSIYAAGNFNNTEDFDPSNGVYDLSPLSYNDGFILKWSQACEGPCVVTDLSDTKQENGSITLLPNPTKGTIQLKMSQRSDLASVEVYDAQGRSVPIIQLGTPNSFLLEGEPGLYMIRLLTKDGTSSIVKVLKE